MSTKEIRTEEIRTEETRTEEIHTEEIRTEEIHTEKIRTEETFILQRQLEEYVSKGLYPLHMPGHKRRVQPAPGLPCDWDVTEVPGTDDLHDAHGILEKAMKRTAALYGADRTWYLVGGSTCGLLAGIRALAGRGSEVLCARNCHKAVFHALELSGYRVRWIMPPNDPEWEICGGIRADQVRAMLIKHPSARAVILTSPTYEGVLSQVEEICEICHEKNIPVLVDEAHGAHLLPLSAQAGFPRGAVACGADLVVQSPHKTLPSLTQTALLHLNGKRIDPGRIERELDIFETSSPSYPLMASLDGCTGILREGGRELFERWQERLARFDARIRSLQKFRILGHGDRSPALYDPGKILIDTRGAGLTGQEAAGILREQFRLETEYARGFHVLAMTSPCDSGDALDRLAAALLDLDAKAAAATAPPFAKKSREENDRVESDRAENGMPENSTVENGRSENGRSENSNAENDRSENDWTEEGPAAEPDHEPEQLTEPLPVQELLRIRPVSACTIARAAEQEAEEVPLAQASGRICAEYLYDYPPGIPFLVPGEIITRRIAEILEREAENGRNFYGRRGREGTVFCLRE